MVSKIFGSVLCVAGLAMMIVGASLFPVNAPSNAFADSGVVGVTAGDPDCDGSCDRCGTAEEQADGSWKCIRHNPNGTFSGGNCKTTGKRCQLCTGGCSVGQVEVPEDPDDPNSPKVTKDVCGCDQISPAP